MRENGLLAPVRAGLPHDPRADDRSRYSRETEGDVRHQCHDHGDAQGGIGYRLRRRGGPQRHRASECRRRGRGIHVIPGRQGTRIPVGPDPPPQKAGRTSCGLISVRAGARNWGSALTLPPTPDPLRHPHTCAQRALSRHRGVGPPDRERGSV